VTARIRLNAAISPAARHGSASKPHTGTTAEQTSFTSRITCTTV